MDRCTNDWVLQQIGGDWRLLNNIHHLKLSYFGHVSRKCNIENYCLTGTVFGKRGCGRCKTRWSDGVKEVTGCLVVNNVRKAQDRSSWRKFIREATATRADETTV